MRVVHTDVFRLHEKVFEDVDDFTSYLLVTNKVDVLCKGNMKYRYFLFNFNLSLVDLVLGF